MSTDSIFISKDVDAFVRQSLHSLINAILTSSRDHYVKLIFDIVSNSTPASAFLEMFYDVLPSTISSKVFERIYTAVSYRLLSLVTEKEGSLGKLKAYSVNLCGAYLTLQMMHMLHKSDARFSFSQNTFSELNDPTLVRDLSALCTTGSFDFSGKYPRLKLYAELPTGTVSTKNTSTESTQESIPTETKENNMSIINRTKPAVEHITFIHGVSINDLTVSNILDIIKEKELNIATLKTIENAPKRVKKEIKRIEAEIKDIVAELDKLEDE